jgi:L-alanine-DL-glutamate epimerase-like enolase superfamily enzyme
MQIASVEVIPYALPFREPYVTASGTLGRREMALLRLRDEEGVTGLGEAVPLSLRGGASIQQVVRELEGLAAREWAPLTPQGPVEGFSAPARCAVETALMDLHGRRAAAETGRPEAEGAPIPCNATLVAGPPAEVAAAAERWAAEGFTTFKLKLGAESVENGAEPPFPQTRGSADIEQVRAVREAVGAAARIRVDVNAAWDLETAKQRLGELEPCEVELAEQPVGTLEEMAELAAATSIPLAADESVRDLREAERAAALGACAYTGIKLSKVGGPAAALAIADVLPAFITSALDGPIGIAAAAEVAQSLAGTDRPERLELAHGLATQRLFATTVAAVECELREGMLYLPPGPGLGVEIDEEALQAHRI